MGCIMKRTVGPGHEDNGTAGSKASKSRTEVPSSPTLALGESGISRPAEFLVCAVDGPQLLTQAAALSSSFRSCC